MNAHGTYRICTRCVMDTTDPAITFDVAGHCNHCTGYLAAAARLPPRERREAVLARWVDDMRRAGRGHDYDCLIGVSGGVDSSYVAWRVRELGLRPLAVHLDNGWNSELAVGNIKRLLDRLGIDLFTVVLDWEEFRQLQLAFLRASTPDSEIPTDHAIVATFYDQARRHGIRHIVSGVNFRTEGIHVRAWSQGHVDPYYVAGVYRRMTGRRLRAFPLIPMPRLINAIVLDRPRSIYLLDCIDYDKAAAKRLLAEQFGWVDYGGKHYESVYTRFYQGYILPVKFGYDKRRMHLSALVMSGQTTRESALAELATPPYDADLAAADRVFVAKKLGITVDEFDAIMRLPPKTYADYPNLQNHALLGPLMKLYRVLKKRNS
ncbi:MAG: N-acetyl sugar amidotransferase [Steroidobacteraceae bacterium]